ncbi:hypothetical protein KUTeg_018285 [Tegillarca granosa]|uniref:Molybdopterin synthase catalytic subunit n=1 Tax=Tegillarca granosa TaxID=220873 RepID=A0ABQ9EHF8_TEGGR|nr:hypothetical protein KUTeg_018285 [Tegillarca granosa]
MHIFKLKSPFSLQIIDIIFPRILTYRRDRAAINVNNYRPTVTLLFFAKSRELSGLKTSQLTTPTQASFQEILNLIVAAFPSLSTATVSVLKVLDRGVISTWKKGWNEVLCHHTIILSKTGRLVWNGMDHVEITESVLDVKHVSDLVTSPSCGAISVFIGTTRDNFNVVPLTEASIIIAISSPHRKESLEAVHFAIDTLKATVPIWKKEIYEDESSTWKENKECTWSESNSK